MAGGKGKTGGKAGPKEAAGKTQKSHSAKAGLQVRKPNYLSGSFWSTNHHHQHANENRFERRH